MKDPTPECTARLRAVYATLRPKPALVADYIFKHPGDVVNRSIGDLAREIGVSQFSVLNCIKAAGFAGYTEFKIALARSIGQEDTLFFGQSEKVDTPYAILCSSFQQRARNLVDSAQLIDRTSYDTAISMIQSADRIAIFGPGHSSYAAEYLSFNLEQMGLSAIFYRDALYQERFSESLTENDLVIAFTASGRNASVLNALKKAKENSCPTIVITSSIGTDVHACADCVLLTTYTDPEVLSSMNNAIIEQIALSAAITMALVREGSEGELKLDVADSDSD